MQFPVIEKRATFKTVYLGNTRVGVGWTCVIRQGRAEMQHKN